MYSITSSTLPLSSLRLSAAQTLPEDVLALLLYILADIDPPTLAIPKLSPAPSPTTAQATSLDPDWCTKKSLWLDEQEQLAQDAHTESTLGWLRFAQVCSRWRAAVFCCGAPLFGRAIHVFPRALELLLFRARDSPLEFDFARRWWCCRACSRYGPLQTHWRESFLKTDRFDCYAALARRSAHRMLRLRGPAEVMRVDGVYPYLRELHLTGPGPHGSAPSQGRVNKHERSPGRCGLHADKHAVVLHAPALHRLVFDGAALIPVCAPALRTLVLHGVRPGACPSTLLALLHVTPSLEKLEVAFSLAHPLPSSVGSGHAVVNLPRLQVTRLAGPAEKLAFWRHIHAPSASLQVHAFLGAQGRAGFDVLLEALSYGWPASERLGLVHGALDFTVTLSSTAPSLGVHKLLHLRTLYRDVVALGGNLPAYVARVLSHFDVGRVQTLHASPCLPAEYHCEDDWFGPREAAAALAPLLKLREMSVSWEARGYQAWLLALGCTGAVVLPSLETLVVVARDERADGGSARSRWGSLIAVLEERARMRCKLPRLVLRGEHDASDAEAWALREWAKRCVGELFDERIDMEY